MDISSILSQFSFGSKAQDMAGTMRPAGVEGPAMANGSFSTPPVNMWELLGNSGLQGAMAGRGDYRGIAGMIEANERTKLMQRRTDMDQQDLQMRQETHRAQMDLNDRKLKSSEELKKLFSDTDALTNDLPGTLLKALPHMIEAGNTAGAHDVFNLVAKGKTDEKTNWATGMASKILQDSRDPKTGQVDMIKFNKGIEYLGNADVIKAANALRLMIGEERQQGAEANRQADREADNKRQDARMAQQHQDFLTSQSNIAARQDKNIAAINERQDKNLQAITDRIMQRPLNQGEQEAISGMQENLRIAQELKNGFTPEERQKYVGFLKNPAQRVAQIAKNDPRFARFQTLTNEVKGFAFAEGGKNLTSTEKQITWGHLPVGNEFSLADYMSNLDRTIERTGSLIDRRINMATSPRSAMKEQLGKDQYTGPDVNQRPRAVNKNGDVMEYDGKKWVPVKK